MATEIRVPTLGESVSEATVGTWFKKVGDAIKADEPILELETDKVTIEVPALELRHAVRNRCPGRRNRGPRRSARPDRRRRCSPGCRSRQGCRAGAIAAPAQATPAAPAAAAAAPVASAPAPASTMPAAPAAAKMLAENNLSGRSGRRQWQAWPGAEGRCNRCRRQGPFRPGCCACRSRCSPWPIDS